MLGAACCLQLVALACSLPGTQHSYLQATRSPLPAQAFSPWTCTSHGAQDDDANASKKARVVWSVEMHQQFVNAVNQLGVDSECSCRAGHVWLLPPWDEAEGAAVFNPGWCLQQLVRMAVRMAVTVQMAQLRPGPLPHIPMPPLQRSSSSQRRCPRRSWRSCRWTG